MDSPYPPRKLILDPDVDVVRLIARAFEHGLVIDRFLFSKDSFRIAPPLNISEKEVELTIQRIMAALDDL